MSFDLGTLSPVSASPSELGRRAGFGVMFLLVGALVLLGVAPLAMPESYSWVEHGTSESGAQGVDGAWVARMGFILYGLAVVWLVRLRAAVWGPLASLLHLAFGVSMFGVAAFSTKPWEDDAAYVESEDLLHSVFAGTIGFSFIAGVVTVMIVRRHRTVRAASPDLVALVIALVVPLLMSSSAWGVLQRLMFLTAGAWYGREAWLSLNRTDRHCHQATITT